MTTLLADNGITKTFKVISATSGEVDVFITKAFDDDTNKHFLIVNIPTMPLLKVERIQLPISFDSEQFRNDAFEKQVNELWVQNTIKGFEQQILSSKYKQSFSYLKNTLLINRLKKQYGL